MKKLLLSLLLISAIAISSLVAETYNFTLVGYVLDSVVFSETENGYQVNSNSALAEYGFYDADGNLTDAYRAKTFNVVVA